MKKYLKKIKDFILKALRNNKKRIIRKLAKDFGIEVSYPFFKGVSIFGLNLRRINKKYYDKSSHILKRCLELPIKTVIDVGSGGGEYAIKLKSSGKKVTCIDYGTSRYADKYIETDGIKLFKLDFNNWKTENKYDLVWASHVLEHQQNSGLFIKKLIDICKNDGYIAITVPIAHRELYGGHLSIWTPGILAYNIILNGIDLSTSELIYGYREFSILFKPKRFRLPEDLTYDYGDVRKLNNFFPSNFSEGGDSWF